MHDDHATRPPAGDGAHATTIGEKSMNVLLLDNKADFKRVTDGFPPEMEKPAILEGGSNEVSPSDSHGVDVIVTSGRLPDHPHLVDRLIAWRTHPYTYLLPCWIEMEHESFSRLCLWPGLSIDRFAPRLDGQSLAEWLVAVAEWQQTRMQLDRSSSLADHGILELISSLALRKASGKLTVFGDDGECGSFQFSKGILADASIRHLKGMEAFYELFSWSRGSYKWDPDCPVSAGETYLPLHHLITEGLNLVREANLLYRFVPDLRQTVSRTESQSALDDLGAPLFDGQETLYGLLDGGASVSEVVEASPMSRPRAMGCLAKWFSFGDVALVGRPEQESGPVPGSAREPELPTESEPPGEPPRRLLIVDDSKLMCHALQDIFSKDPRFEIAGTAHDGVEALELIDRAKPDVVTLDMQMPRMDGLTALKHIMIRNPKPVVVLSAFTRETSELTYASFKYGAVDVCTKPSGSNMDALRVDAREIGDRVAGASRVKLDAARYIRRGRDGSKGGGSATKAGVGHGGPPGRDECLAIILCGAGGFPSLLKLLLSISQGDSIPRTVVCMAIAPPGGGIPCAAHRKRLRDEDRDGFAPGNRSRARRLLVPLPGIPLPSWKGKRTGSGFTCGRLSTRPADPLDRLLAGAARSFGEHTAVFPPLGLRNGRYCRDSGGATIGGQSLRSHSPRVSQARSPPDSAGDRPCAGDRHHRRTGFPAGDFVVRSRRGDRRGWNTESRK